MGGLMNWGGAEGGEKKGPEGEKCAEKLWEG